MWDDGLCEEATHLLTLYPAAAKPFTALGYKQAIDFLAHRLSKDEAISEMQMKTRHYAKRQLTWFRAENDVIWLPGFGPQKEIFEQSLIHTERFLRLSV